MRWVDGGDFAPRHAGNLTFRAELSFFVCGYLFRKYRCGTVHINGSTFLFKSVSDDHYSEIV